MKKRISIILAVVMALLCLAACGQNKSKYSSKNDKIKVVTTIFPEYDWVREIAGENSNVDITMLLDNGVDLHSYQPTAEDIMKISSCDMFIYVGGESDEWVEDALKESVNKNMKVINLLDVLKDTVKTEEAMPGMQSEEGHNHGYSHFDDSDVQDRSLTDWSGEWQSVYPYIENGDLDEVMERKAESGDKTAEEYKKYYETGYKTDVEKMSINGEEGTMEFTKNGVTSKAKYEYKGYKIYDYSSGNRGVCYFFESVDNASDAPKYVQFSDHGISPSKAEHYHIYAGNDSFDALSEEMDNWPTYYPAGMTSNEIKEDMLEHEEKEYDEHVWLSLRNAEKLCDAIADSLCDIDSENKNVYSTNAAVYKNKLKELDDQYRNVVKNSTNKTLLFGDRFPFRYMVDDYGLKYYAAFAGCSAESEASFETISFLAKKVDELGLKNVMTIEKSDKKIANTIISNTKNKNQKIFELNSLQSTTSKDVKNGVTYLSVMKSNLNVLKEALQ
ncbi:MAG: ZinT/AdcA family metal-binding protein [Lachnospira sp.]